MKGGGRGRRIAACGDGACVAYESARTFALLANGWKAGASALGSQRRGICGGASRMQRHACCASRAGVVCCVLLTVLVALGLALSCCLANPMSRPSGCEPVRFPSPSCLDVLVLCCAAVWWWRWWWCACVQAVHGRERAVRRRCGQPLAVRATRRHARRHGPRPGHIVLPGATAEAAAAPRRHDDTDRPGALRPRTHGCRLRPPPALPRAAAAAACCQNQRAHDADAVMTWGAPVKLLLLPLCLVRAEPGTPPPAFMVCCLSTPSSLRAYRASVDD